MIVGLPGIAIACLILATLREPPRGMTDKVPLKQDVKPPPMGETLRFLWSKRSFRHLGLGAGLHAFVSYGYGTWTAPFLLRSHELTLSEVGSWLALISGIGVIGTFSGGYLGDKLSSWRNDTRWYLWVSGISTLVMVPFQFMVFLHGDLWMVIGSMFAASVLGGMFLGPSFAIAHALVAPRMRAVASATLLFLINIIGMGLGPYVVGILSDLLAPAYAADSLRYALCIALTANIWASAHYFLGARTLRGDLQAAHTGSSNGS